MSRSVGGAGVFAAGGLLIVVGDVVCPHLAPEPAKADNGDDSERKDDQADGGRGRTSSDERDEQQVPGGEGQYQGSRVGSGVTKGGVSRTVERPPP